MKTKKLLAVGAVIAACPAVFFLSATSNASTAMYYHHLFVKTNGDTQSIRFEGTAAGTGHQESWCVNPASWGFTPWVNGWVDGKVTMVDYTKLTVTAYSGPNCDRYQYNSKTNTVPGPDKLSNFWDDLT
ncbi:MAG: hypothetical protein JO362_01835 [Streptomycetaceae bacterium]|nr:hypothetical protein [Streptomycetaceae bacterium]